MCLLWRFVLLVFSVYVCMRVYMAVSRCAHVYGDLKSTLGVVPQVPSPSFFGDRVSYCPGSHPVS